MESIFCIGNNLPGIVCILDETLPDMFSVGNHGIRFCTIGKCKHVSCNLGILDKC